MYSYDMPLLVSEIQDHSATATGRAQTPPPVVGMLPRN
jgi:hypothetical protein